LTHLERPAELERCLKAALSLLKYRPRSPAELKRRLSHKGFLPMVIEEVLGKLKEQGLVDDLSFAIFWKESRQNFNPRSRRLVQKELRDKGISPEMAMEVTRDWDEEQAAYRAARKKVRMLKGQDFQTFRQKLAGFLRRRGFSWEITRNTIERLWREGIS